MTMTFSFVFPFLLTIALCQKGLILFKIRITGCIPTVILAALSAVMVIVPMGDLPVGRWLISVFPNPSIPLTALLFSWIFKNAFSLNLLNTEATQTCRVFSLLAGGALYPMALGAGPFDPYCAGWHFSWLFVVLLVVTLALLFLLNRFSVVLLATICAYNLHLLESSNLWDYLVDPVLVLVSVGTLLGSAWKRYFGVASV